MTNTMQHLNNDLPGFDIMLMMPRAKSMLKSMSNVTPKNTLSPLEVAALVAVLLLLSVLLQ